MVGRRLLAFEHFDEIMVDVDRLLLGHTTLGGWSLGQILSHLASGVRLCLEGDRMAVGPVDPEMARTYAVRRRFFFRKGRFPDEAEIPHGSMVPARDADARSEAESLRSALGLLGRFDGRFATHPVLGPLSKDEWGVFHRIHCAHHLGFAVPTSDQEGGR